MYKKIMEIIFLCFAVLLTGCADRSNVEDKKVLYSNNEEITVKEEKIDNDGEDKKEKYKINEFIDLEDKASYNFQCKNSEYTKIKRFTDYVEGNKIQYRSNNGGTEVVTVQQVEDGELKVIFKRSQCFYRENFLKKKSNINDVLLKEPLVEGTTWKSAEGKKRYISKIDVDVTTPSGLYKAVEVTTEGSDGSIDLEYYAPKVGLVKSVSDAKGLKVTSILAKIEKDEKLVQSISFFYPKVTDTDYDIVCEKKDVSFKADDITKVILQNIMRKESSSGEKSIISQGTVINSLYLNDDNMLYVDFNKKLIEEMNAGSGYECTILSCIADTFGAYYKVDKVYITIEGEPYSSGHILKTKGEYFNVDLLNLPQ